MSNAAELKQQVDKATELLVNLQLENMELKRKLWEAKVASHQPISEIHPYTK